LPEFTVTVTVAECVFVPSVPVTVTVYVPAATVTPTVTVNVAELPAVTLVGLIAAVGPAGLTEVVKLTVPDPPTAAVAIVLFPLPPVPWVNDIDVGFAEMVKSGVVVLVIVSDTVVVCVPLAAVPVIVSV